MNSQNKDLIVDADAHVVECGHTWDFMDKSEEKYRPIELEAREEAGLRRLEGCCRYCCCTCTTGPGLARSPCAITR